ncbi:MAG: DUF4350 domain-containing protein [Myxococcota bacterium]|nr:DUF4350 domain-containing protein [Myxococcota bacterium]
MFDRRTLATLFFIALWTIGITGMTHSQTHRWNTFSKFINEAKEQSILSMAPLEQVRASEPSQTSLILLDPVCSDSDRAKLQGYVEGGGRLVLVAEHPKARACFDAFGLSLTESTSPTFEHGPIIRLRINTPFFEQHKTTGFLLANHPRKLISADGFEPAIVTKDGEGIVFKLSFGQGRLIAMSDSSLFINQMLEVTSNVHLMRRVLQWTKTEGRIGFLFGPKTKWDVPRQSFKASTRFSKHIGRIILICFAALAGIVLVMLTLTRMTSLMSKPGEQIYIIQRPEQSAPAAGHQTPLSGEGSET